MKNATQYEKKVRKLLKDVKGSKSDAPLDEPRLRVLIRSVFETDATTRQGEQALEAIDSEYVDYNELRISPPKDIVETVGRDHPRVREKAIMLREALNRFFERDSTPSMDYLDELSKRDLRQHLAEAGLEPYPAAAVTLLAFGGHAVPVDGMLVDALKLDECVHPESDIEDVQGFLERVVSQKNDVAVLKFFRAYVEKSRDAVMAHRQAEAERIAAEKAAEEAAARKAEEEAQAKAAEAEAKKKAAAEKKTKSKKRKSAKAAKKSRAKKAGKAKKKTVGATKKKAADTRGRKRKKSSKASKSSGSAGKSSGKKSTRAGKKSSKKDASTKTSKKKSASKKAKKSGQSKSKS